MHNELRIISSTCFMPSVGEDALGLLLQGCQLLADINIVGVFSPGLGDACDFVRQ